MQPQVIICSRINQGVSCIRISVNYLLFGLGGSSLDSLEMELERSPGFVLNWRFERQVRAQIFHQVNFVQS